MKTKETSKFKVGDTIKCIKSFWNPETQTQVEKGYIVRNMTQFGIDCLSHSECWEKVESTREQAIAWWKQLTDGRRNYFIGYHLFQFRDQDSLTGREIEEIWMKETQNNIVNWDENPETILKDKPNQKQFKQFDESLFKAYVDKFSDEDKVAALRVLFKSIGITSKDKLEYFLAKY